MVHKRLVILLHDNTHIMDAGVLQAGKSDVDESVSSAEGQRSAGAQSSQLSQLGEGMISVYYSVNVIHLLASTLS